MTLFRSITGVSGRFALACLRRMPVRKQELEGRVVSIGADSARVVMWDASGREFTASTAAAPLAKFGIAADCYFRCTIEKRFFGVAECEFRHMPWRAAQRAELRRMRAEMESLCTEIETLCK